ncbi:MAG: hypothetical protein WCY48_04095 [Candidatus Caldatribacteriota bacterium]
MKRSYFLILFCFIQWTYAQHWEDEISEFDSYRKECLNYKSRITDYEINCFYNFHHFNASKRDAKTFRKNIQIAEFNMLHPGMKKTWLKDYDLLAQIINEYDVVAATELIPLTNRDRKFNDDLEKFINDTPKRIEKLKEEIALEEKKANPNLIKIAAIRSAINELNDKLNKAPTLFIKPGYLQLLEALNARYRGRWSLVLSPRGEARNTTDTNEHVGFYYRNDRVSLIPNKFCTEIKTLGHEETEACLIPMGPAFMGEDYRPIFSRRPFMASFKARDFDFNILSSHIVFNSPQDELTKNNILKKVFGTTNIAPIIGLNNENYARQAEVKITLNFIKKIREELNMTNTLWAGDFNLENSNPFFQKLVSINDFLLQIDGPTSLATKRVYTDGSLSYGKASNYDHFIFHQDDFLNCYKKNGEFDGSIYYFHENKFHKKIESKYLIRNEKNQEINSKLKAKRLAEIKVPDFFTIKNVDFPYNRGRIRVRSIVVDEKMKEEYREDFASKILNSQGENDQYYSVYRNLISDHFPISMKCAL